jgi:hypothetical protein
MLVMPANSTGWFFHCLARETGRLGHLFSPEAQRGPYPWFPYSLDNGAFSCWDRNANVFDDEKWEAMLPKWKRLLFWAQCQEQKARWAIVPDVIGDANRTLERWEEYAPMVQDARIPLAIAVQDGMTAGDVRSLAIQPEVIAIGGTDDFKWGTVDMWAREFPRVHLLRCNSPTKLYELEAMGVESCDGTGWNRGDRKQTNGLERWAYSRAVAVQSLPTLGLNVQKTLKEAKQLLLA